VVKNGETAVSLMLPIMRQRLIEELPDGTLKRVVAENGREPLVYVLLFCTGTDIDPVPHLICEGFTKEESEDALIELNYLGIHNVLAIRGDNTGSQISLNLNGTVNKYAIDLVNRFRT
jgi:methylenetetrahydrofolate reductase (NADPH)